MAGREHLVLRIGGQPRIQRQHFGARKAAGEYARRVTDLAFTRQKDQHVAIRPAAPEIVDRRGDCAFLIAVIGQRAEIGRAHVELQSLMRISYAVYCLKKKTRVNKKEYR